jgi:polyribonucleotide nucleotidyltransferase
MDLLLTGLKSESKKEILINMIDAGMNEIPEETILKAVEMSKKYHQDILNFQEDIKNKIGKEKIEVSLPQSNEEVEKLVKEVVGNRIENIFKKNPTDDMHKIRDDLALKLKEIEDADALRYGFSFFEEYSEKIIHQSIIEKGLRFEERGTEEIREIFCDVSKIPMVHGSGFLKRGNKVLSFLTLGSPGDQKVFDEMERQEKKRFMHHYNFPPSCVGEIGPLRGPEEEKWSRNVGRKGTKTSYP